LVAFQTAAASHPEAALAWLERLKNIPDEAINEVVDAVPERLMPRTAKDFACALLECNAKLLGVR